MGRQASNAAQQGRRLPSTLPFSTLLSAWDTWVFTGALVIVLPCFAYFCLYRGAQGQGYFGRISKAGTYLWITFSLWSTLGFLAVVAHRHHLSMADLGQHLRHPTRTLTMTAILLSVMIVLSALDFWKHRQMPPDALEQRLAKLRHFFPSSPSEIVTFAAMAISAGICEELLYRGWLLHLIGASTGSVWLGLLLSSVAFGLGHAYQGPQGILATGFVGLVLGLIFMWVGSLVPVQILHAFINLSSGLMCAYLLAGSSRSGGKVSSP